MYHIYYWNQENNWLIIELTSSTSTLVEHTGKLVSKRRQLLHDMIQYNNPHLSPKEGLTFTWEKGKDMFDSETCIKLEGR